MFQYLLIIKFRIQIRTPSLQTSFRPRIFTRQEIISNLEHSVEMFPLEQVNLVVVGQTLSAA